MAASKTRSLLLGLILSVTGVATAQEEVLFEDTFTGSDGTVIATGSGETYRIVGRDGTILTPAIENNRLALAIGPNPSGANNFSALHHNTRFDFLTRPVLFESEIDLGDLRPFHMALHTWLGNTRIEAVSNSLTVGFFGDGTRLLLTARNSGTETVRHEISAWDRKEFRLGIYLDATEVKLLVDGEVVFTGLHGLSHEQFAPGAYLAFQIHGGQDAAQTVYLDNVKVVANPDLTPPPPEPTVLFEDTFTASDGTVIATGSGETYRIVGRDGTILTPAIENNRLALAIGPNPSGVNNFSALHHNTRFDFLTQPVLFESEIDLGDLRPFHMALHTWLGNTRIEAVSNSLTVGFFGDGTRLLLTARNSGTETVRHEITTWDKKEFRLGIYLDQTEVKLLVDGEILFTGPHGLSHEQFAPGAYLAFQIHGGENAAQTVYLDNVKVVANPDLTPPEIVPGDIFWATATAIRSSRFDGSDKRTLVSGLGRPIGLAVDFDAELLYWVEHDTGLLMQADTTGGNIVELRSDVDTGQLLAVDGGQLYWAEWNQGLFASPVDGSERTNLIPSAFNGSAGVAVTDDRVFLVSANSGTVTSQARDGTGTPESVTTFAGQTYAIAADPSGQELYATNFSENWIRVYDLQSGGDPRTVWNSGLSRPLGLTVSSDGQKLYWTERTLDLANGMIRMANSDGTGEITTLVEGEASPFGIAVRPFSSGPTGFFAWIGDYDLPQGETGPGDNPSGDGIPNLLKYALGLNPAESARAELPRPVVGDIEGSAHLSLTVNRNPDAAGLTWTFEVSSDLVEWSSAESDVLVVEEGNALTGWSVQSLDEGERLFMRVRVGID